MANACGASPASLACRRRTKGVNGQGCKTHEFGGISNLTAGMGRAEPHPGTLCHAFFREVAQGAVFPGQDLRRGGTCCRSSRVVWTFGPVLAWIFA
jgi:hypothetical protein